MARYKKFDINTPEGVIKTPVFSWDELQEYLAEHPDYSLSDNDKVSDLGSPLLHSGRPMSVYKTDGAFNEKLKSLKRFYPRNNINVSG